MTYEIRTNDGTIKAVVTNRVAQNLIQQAQGFFKDVKFVNLPEKVTVFEMKVEGRLNFDQISIPLFPGDRLIPVPLG